MSENRKALRQERETCEKFRKVFLSTPEGKEVLGRLVDYSGILDQAFTGNSSTYFNLGKQEVGLYLLAKCDLRTIDAINAEDLELIELGDYEGDET